ncbi:MAG: DUF1080 domain-containing protein [Pedosphaera sp.]|nr:DUF1080 domain-containing protein [Pedosphaera sp.]MSS99698.1 DUF1080 domain-containing protein [Pedosphaera sp.]
MKTTTHIRRLLVVLFACALIARGAEEGFVPLFNGKNLSGWVPVNVAPGTFTVREGIIISTGKPTGVMRTERMYENFIIELEWRHLKSGGNAGLFIWGDPMTARGTPFARGIEVQILDNGYAAKGKNEWFTTHGDIFPIHGATMTPAGLVAKSGRRSFPSEELSKSAPEWNHYRVVANNGEVRLSVNGKEVTVGRDSSPRKGYLCLESEGSECHFRNIRIKELPSSSPSPDQIAKAAEGFTTLYTGVDLAGWRADAPAKEHWRVSDWRLECDAKAGTPPLTTEQEFGDFVMIVDWLSSAKPDSAKPGDVGSISLRGVDSALVKLDRAQSGSWHRLQITLRGDELTVEQDGKLLGEKRRITGTPKRGPIVLRAAGEPITFANLFVRELK